MSILSWFFKPKKKMAEKNTPNVRIGKYNVSSHAQNRVADNARNLKKKDMVVNLLGKSENSPTYQYKDGTLQYDRVNEKNRTITHITGKQNVVKTIYKYHDTERARKQTYKNFDKEKKQCVSRKK